MIRFAPIFSIAIPLFSVFISLAAFAYSLSNSRFQARRDITIRMFERWSSSHFNEHRARAFEMFADAKGLSTERKFAQQYLIGNSEYIRHFGAIEHFIVDLGRLAENKQLDRSLSRALFFDSVQFWDYVFSWFDWQARQEGWEIEVSDHIAALHSYWRRVRPSLDQRLHQMEMYIKSRKDDPSPA